MTTTNSELRRTLTSAALERARNQLCDECGKPIENCRLKQKLHDGPCEHAYRNRKRRTGDPHRKKVLKSYDCLCEECKEWFTSARSTSKICKKLKCKNDAQRKKAKIAYNDMSEDEKKAWRSRKYNADKPGRAVYKKTKFKIIAKCPRCEDDHEIIVYAMDLPRVKPRVFCVICKKTVEAIGDNAFRYRASFPAMREYHAI